MRMEMAIEFIWVLDNNDGNGDGYGGENTDDLDNWIWVCDVDGNDDGDDNGDDDKDGDENK